jgi:hypothetical protein
MIKLGIYINAYTLRNDMKRLMMVIMLSLFSFISHANENEADTIKCMKIEIENILSKRGENRLISVNNKLKRVGETLEFKSNILFFESGDVNFQDIKNKCLSDLL